MRYFVALLMAFFIIGLGASYVWGTMQWLQQKRAALPDPNQWEDVGMEVTSAEMLRINLADFLVNFSFVLIPGVIVVALVIAARLKPDASTKIE